MYCQIPMASNYDLSDTRHIQDMHYMTSNNEPIVSTEDTLCIYWATNRIWTTSGIMTRYHVH